MSTTYKSVPGDTFDIIARKTTGFSTDAASILRLNPDVLEPIPAGTVLNIPTRSQILTDAEPDENNVVVEIDDERFRFWSFLSITQQYDSLRKASFSAPLDDKFKTVLVPLTYKRVTISFGDKRVFTGIIVKVSPSTDVQSSTVSVDCYSLPGVLNDCYPPVTAFPLEFKNQTLRDISSALAGTLNVNLDDKSEQTTAFKKVSLSTSKKILPFLITLAKQRGRYFSDDENGNLLIQSGTPGLNVGALVEGFAPLQQITPIFNEQQYFSHVTAISKTVTGRVGENYTVKNPFLDGVTRPFVFTAEDSFDGDVKRAAEAAIARMFVSSISFTVSVNTWRSPSGSMWAAGDRLTVTAPGAMIYSATELVIREVSLTTDSGSMTAQLRLTLPGLFTGEIPESLPWTS